jgi:hypothetical protein
LTPALSYKYFIYGTATGLLGIAAANAAGMHKGWAVGATAAALLASASAAGTPAAINGIVVADLFQARSL